MIIITMIMMMVMVLVMMMMMIMTIIAADGNMIKTDGAHKDLILNEKKFKAIIQE